LSRLPPKRPLQAIALFYMIQAQSVNTERKTANKAAAVGLSLRARHDTKRRYPLQP
jgi:hypothetical protein